MGSAKSPNVDQIPTLTPIPISPQPGLKIHHSLIPYCLPLTQFLLLPSNKDKTLLTGAAILHSSSTPSDPTILLLQRASTVSAFPHQWEFPGGHLESSDRNIIESMFREVHEETGLRVKSVRSRFQSFEYGEEKVWKQYNFVVEVYEGEVVLNNREHLNFKWIGRKDLEVEGTFEKKGGLEMSEIMRECVMNGLRAIEEMGSSTPREGSIPSQG